MIPHQFTLVNRVWKVYCVDDTIFQLMFPGKTVKGLTDHYNGLVLLNIDQHGDAVDLYHTFYHELTHCLLYADGNHDEDHPEQWVDRWGGFLHQALHTQKGFYELRETSNGITVGNSRRDTAKAISRLRRYIDDRGGEESGGQGDKRVGSNDLARQRHHRRVSRLSKARAKLRTAKRPKKAGHRKHDVQPRVAEAPGV